MSEKKEIKVNQEIRVELMKEFPVCEKTIWNALKFATDGYTAQQIRRRAQELGGTLMVEQEADGDTNELRSDCEAVAKEEQVCEGCVMAEYPPCDKGIPCCKCKDKASCNSRQVCEK